MILHQRNRMSRNRRGFTLMEVLVVVAILVILASVSSIFVFRYLDQAKDDRAKADLAALTTACQSYKLHYQEYPPSLQSLIQPPEGKPFMDSPEAILDPWGRQYQYDANGARNNGLKPDIWTTGSNGQEIGNWSGGH